MRRSSPGSAAATGSASHAASRLHAIVEAQRAIAAADLDLQSVMTLICERTQELTGADGAAVLLPEEDSFRYGAGSGFVAGLIDGRLTFRSLSGWAFLNNESALSNDMASDPRVHTRAARDNQALSMIVVPLRHGSNAIGLLQVSARRPHAFDEEDVQTLDLLSVVLSAAMSHASEFEALGRFRTMFDRAPIGVARLAQSGKVIEANEALSRMLGYDDPDELVGTTFAELTDPADAEESIARFRCLLAGEYDTYRFEKRYRRRDGETIWCQATATALERDADGRPGFVIAMIEDVTERKLAELALREHTDRLGQIVETQAEIAALDLNLDSAMQLLVTRAQALSAAEAAAINLIEGDELVTRAATGLMADAVGLRRPLASTPTADAIRTGRPLLVEHSLDETRIRAPLAEAFGDGSLVLVPLFRGGEAVGTLAVASSERARRLTEDDRRTTELLGVMLSSVISRAAEFEAKQAQLEAMSQFEAAWRMSPIGIEMIALDGHVVAANPALDDVYGYTLDEYASMYVADFTHPDDVTEVARRFFRLIKGQCEDDTCTIEARFFHKSRGLVWVNGSMALVRDASGEPQYVLGMAQNVTESKLAELALRESEERQSQIAETQAEVAATGLDLEAAMRLVADRSYALTNADGAAVLLHEGDELVTVASSGPAGVPLDARVPYENSVSADTLRAGRPVLVADPDDPRLYRPVADRLDVKSLASVPLFRGGKSVGVIVAIGTSLERPLADDDVRTLNLLSVVLSSAMSRAAELEAERRQVESLAQFEAIYRDSPIGVAVVDLGGYFVKTNEQMRAITGHTAEYLAQRTVASITHPDDVDKLVEMFTRMLAGECDSYRVETRTMCRDGSIVWTDTAVSMVCDAETPFAIAMSQDITERKHAELALAESNERLAAITETQAAVAASGADVAAAMQLVAERSHTLTAADGAAIMLEEDGDLVTLAASGSATFRPGHRQPAGQSATNEAIVTGRTILITDPADPRLYRPVVEELGIRSLAAAPLFRGGKAVGAIVARTASDDGVLGDDDVRTLDLLAVVLSAAMSRSAELDAERRRVEALSRFEAIFHNSPVGIGLIALDGTWIESNETYESIIGRTEAERRGTTVVETAHPEDVTNMARKFGRMLRGEQDTYQLETRHFHKDGSLVWSRAQVSLVRDADGEPMFAIAVSEVVTEQKLAEIALQEKTERLARIVETQGQVAAAGGDLEQVMALVTENALALSGADAATVALLEGDELVARAATGHVVEAVGVRLPLAEATMTQRALAEGRAILVQDAADVNVPKAWLELLGDDASFVAVPLYQGSRPAGVLTVASSVADKPLTEEDRQTLELFGAMLSSAITSAAEVEALARFETVYHGSPTGIALMSLDGRLTQANAAMCETTGRTTEELADLFVSDFIHPDDVELVVDKFRGMVRGEFDSYRIESRTLRKDGTVVWMDTAVSLVRNADGTARFAVVMAQDTTQRKLAELALHESTQRLARIVETQSQIAQAGLDLNGVMRLIGERAQALTRADGALVDLVEDGHFVTRAATGVAAGALGTRRPVSASIGMMQAGGALLVEQAEDDPRLDRSLADAIGVKSLICVPLLQSGKVAGALTIVGTGEGERLGEEDRQTIELLGVVLSSAVSRAAEFEALTRLEAIYQGAPIGIGLLNLEGVVIDANQAMCDITGHTREELAVMPVSDNTHPDDVEEMSGKFRRMVSGEFDSYRYEARHFHKLTGELVWVDASVSLLRDTDGRPRFAIAMAQNVTHKRQAEEQLRQSQKIEAIGQLSAGIAHDFNNLLMGVLGYAGLARGEVDPESRAFEYLEKIEKTGHRAASLTKQLLAFGRRQTLQARPLDLNELVSETLSMLERVLGEHIEIVPRLDPRLPALRADPTQLQQVLFNLALNARDAMPGGGLLTIETTCIEIEDGEAPSALELAAGPHVVLEVVDTGVGMSPEVLERIFEPFFTTKGVGEGTGLGLPSVHGIVKQSRGDIEVTSEPGHGTSFRIYLPAAEEIAPRKTATKRGPAARVLVVEDAQVVRDLVETLLAEHGYEVVVAEDPAHALRLAQEEPPFDVLLTDLVLARTSGADLAARIQEHQPNVRVLYMSAYEPDQRVDPDALIPKPFGNDELLEKLASTLGAEAGV